MTHDIHSTVYPTRTMTSATPSPVQDNKQHGEIGASLGGHRLAAHVNRPNKPFFATDAYDLIGIHSISEHAARAYPEGFSDEGVGERQHRQPQHSMQKKTEYVSGYRHRGRDRERGYTQGCERDRDGRAACRGLREHPHHEHIHEQVAQLLPQRFEAERRRQGTDSEM